MSQLGGRLHEQRSRRACGGTQLRADCDETGIIGRCELEPVCYRYRQWSTLRHDPCGRSAAQHSASSCRACCFTPLRSGGLVDGCITMLALKEKAGPYPPRWSQHQGAFTCLLDDGCWGAEAHGLQRARWRAFPEASRHTSRDVSKSVGEGGYWLLDQRIGHCSHQKGHPSELLCEYDFRRRRPVLDTCHRARLVQSEPRDPAGLGQSPRLEAHLGWGDSRDQAAASGAETPTQASSPGALDIEPKASKVVYIISISEVSEESGVETPAKPLTRAENSNAPSPNLTLVGNPRAPPLPLLELVLRGMDVAGEEARSTTPC